jgi:sigma-E factor negative regulatory protein RseB
MHRLLWVSLLWSVGLLPVAGGESQKVQDLLEKMKRAVTELNYQGTFIYLHDSHLQTMQILHTARGGLEKERLWSLNGAVTKLLRDANKVTCITPESSQVSVDTPHSHRRFPTLLPDDLRSLSRHYTFHLLGKDRIAGRFTKVVAIIPEDTSHRYGYRLYLDDATALPLKSDLMDEMGNPIAQIMFTSIQLDPETPAEVIEKGGQQAMEKMVEARHLKSSRNETSGWRFNWMPPGFKRTADNQWLDPIDGTKVEQIVLSDGLASLSVYIEQLAQGQENSLNGSSRVGAVNAWGRTYGSYQVTAVGEVPQKTVQKVVENLEYNQPD